MRSLIRSVALAVAVAALLVAPSAAANPTANTEDANTDAGSSTGAACEGITTAYAHANSHAAGALEAVAARLGCDLSGVEPVTPPGQTKSDVTSGDDSSGPNAAPPSSDSANRGGPNADAKCAKIAEKLAAAQARPHGKSADAFSRQATSWGCPTT